MSRRQDYVVLWRHDEFLLYRQQLHAQLRTTHELSAHLESADDGARMGKGISTLRNDSDNCNYFWGGLFFVTKMYQQGSEGM